MANEVIKLSLVGIQIISKTMAEQPQNPGAFQFQFEVKDEIKVNASSKLIVGNVILKIQTLDDATTQWASLNMSCVFEIENFEDVILPNEQKLYIIPPHLEMVIRPVSISTARGVMYSELRGTYLNNVVLPVIYIVPTGMELPNTEKVIEKEKDSI